MTDADVVTCSRGVSVRVAVTNTGGNVTSAVWAAPRKRTRKKKMKTVKNCMTPPFPAKGEVEADRIGLLARGFARDRGRVREQCIHEHAILINDHSRLLAAPSHGAFAEFKVPGSKFKVGSQTLYL